jgi:ABC-2 type transport system permease protein
MSAFATHFLFEFKTGIRNKTLLLMNYLFPLGFYLMMGAIMPGINPLFRDTMIPAMIVFAVLAATFLGLPDPLVNARESGVLRSYKINGVPAASILLIPGLTTGLHLAIVVLLITFTAPLLFDAAVPANGLNFFLVMVALSLACAGLGLLIGVVSPSTRMTVLYSQVIFIPSMILGGLMLPYSLLPQAARYFAQLMPATHAMNAFNGLAMGATADFSPWASVAILASGGVLAFGLALYLFNWDNKNSQQRGHRALALLAFLPYVLGILLLQK